MHFMHLNIEKKDREAKRVIEVYKTALYPWLTELERWRKELEEKTFVVGYDPAQRHCSRDEIGRFLSISAGYEFKEKIILSRIKKLNEKILTEREKVRRVIKDLYNSLDRLSRVIDTEDFRIWISRLYDSWEGRPHIGFNKVISGVVGFLITEKEFYEPQDFIKKFKKQLQIYRRQKVEQLPEWREVENKIQSAKNAITYFQEFLTELMKKHESKYQLVLEELEHKLPSLYGY